MNRTITKAELVNQVLKNTDTDIEQQAIEEVIEQVFSAIKKDLENGDNVQLRGFGTFEPLLRNGRKAARNLHTGETFDVPPHFVAHFRPGQDLKKNMLLLSPGDFTEKHEK